MWIEKHTCNWCGKDVMCGCFNADAQCYEVCVCQLCLERALEDMKKEINDLK